MDTPVEVKPATLEPTAKGADLEQPDPCAIVIFGAGGDLTKRLVAPALYNLSRTNKLPEDFAVIGVDLAPGNTEGWVKNLRAMLQSFVGSSTAELSIGEIDEKAWNWLAERMSYMQGDLTKPGLYAEIETALEEVEEEYHTKGNVIFYLAVADRFFGTVVEQLGKSGLANEDEDGDGQRNFWRRVVIEKPFGHDLPSARELNHQILRVLNEDQIFRIDHFLGKDAVQSIMAFRFGNGLFEPIWNRDRIDHVQITAAETVGVELRGKFYDATGALRDMVPNHLFSLLAMVAIEPPVSFEAQAIRDKKCELYRAIKAVDPKRAVRGQYGPGTVLGKRKVAYRDEPNVAPDSNTETFVALEVNVDNWRWAGVPFFLRTGKHMSMRETEIAIRFKAPPYAAFQNTPVASLPPNWLVLRIAPDDGISLQFEVKRRGAEMELAAVKMDFRYDDYFPKMPNVGYETLIHDIMQGDQTLFMRADMVEEAWRIVEPVLTAWGSTKASFPNYESGTDGPAEADDLISSGSDRHWRTVGADLKKKGAGGNT
ncbi:MAG TPA: glucose-6-phosphate dehydrogenase [Devosiaceae bacterium]|jgi:glucose-6-phosphate 1-dehydrogenase|nr:glucose-6-phosphate dehydrogenase [Devosiaceae bacterium]